MEITKICRRCGEEKPRSSFYPLREKYVSAYCIPCVKLNSKESGDRNPERRADVRRRHAAKERGTAWGRAGQIREGMVARSKAKGWPPPEPSRQEIFDAISEGSCAKTGIPFSFQPTAGSRNPWTPVPDRIDPTRPYVRDNIQWVCNMYNSAKQSWTDDDVWVMIQAAFAKKADGNF